MLVLQDFEALTPNLLARTVETIEGGGLVVFLLQSVSSLRQLYTLTMVYFVFFKSVSTLKFRMFTVVTEQKHTLMLCHVLMRDLSFLWQVVNHV